MPDCPLNDGCYPSSCELCSQKMVDCILLTILQKVKNLEGVIEKAATQKLTCPK